MKKLLVLAMAATLLMAGSAFAGAKTHLVASPDATFAFGAPGVAVGPTTTNNDDSCDIGTAPAATLLLPYFEVDFKSPAQTARTTIFTITNTTDLPQIAHVVIWTDWSFPALDFNIFLTGYDVQGINLYDIFNRGIIAPGPTAATGGTSSSTTPGTGATAGSQASANTANPNITSLAGCTNLPGNIPPAYVTDLQSIFTVGKGSGAGISCTSTVGGAHANAVGYITIDVAPTCHTSLPNQAGYFSLINFDNVLIGDYQDINPNQATGNYAGGNPLVHIRAVPEGGPAGSIPGTNLPYTFYDRYTAGTGLPRTVDRRQPLPSTFAARFIQGGTGAFNTNFKIWREGYSTGACSGAQAASLNSNIAVAEVVRFDEHENSTVLGGGVIISPPPPGAPGTPETGSYNTATSSIFPTTTSADLGGWMYLNLNNGGSANYSTARVGFAPAGSSTLVRPSQNWVIIQMFAEGRYSVDFDAAWLGNGCSPAALPSSAAFIGPAGGVPVCPATPVNTAPLTCAGNPAYIGTNATP